MKRLTVTLVLVSLLGAGASAVSAQAGGTKLITGSCGASNSFCTAVKKKEGDVIVLQLGAFLFKGNYELCVTEDGTKSCQEHRLHRVKGENLFRDSVKLTAISSGGPGDYSAVWKKHGKRIIRPVTFTVK